MSVNTVKFPIRGVTPALRLRLVAVRNPQWTQSTAPTSLKLITEFLGIDAKSPVRLAACEELLRTIRPRLTNEATRDKSILFAVPVTDAKEVGVGELR